MEELESILSKQCLSRVSRVESSLVVGDPSEDCHLSLAHLFSTARPLSRISSSASLNSVLILSSSKTLAIGRVEGGTGR